jgi:hypothetical protein
MLVGRQLGYALSVWNGSTGLFRNQDDSGGAIWLATRYSSFEFSASGSLVHESEQPLGCVPDFLHMNGLEHMSDFPNFARRSVTEELTEKLHDTPLR